MNSERQVASLCFLGLGFCLSLAILSLLVGVEASRAGDKFDGLLRTSGESGANPKINSPARDRAVRQWTTKCLSSVDAGGNQCGTCGATTVESHSFPDPQKDGEPSYYYTVTGSVYGCESQDGFVQASQPRQDGEGDGRGRGPISGGGRVQIGS